MLFYGKTDVGKRRSANQDNFTIRKYSDDVLYAVVCDGMGGANGGNIASSMAAGVFGEMLDRNEHETPSFFGMSEEEILAVLKNAAVEANRTVFEKSQEDRLLSGMGTTLVGCIVSGEHAYIVNIGDSRMYLIENDTIEQVTHDHSYVQYLVDNGKITPEEAKNSKNKNLITRAVGTESAVEADLFTCHVKPGTYAVLCSDGLTNHVDPQEICDVVMGEVGEKGDVQAACETLIGYANSRGGLDNITVVILSL